MTAHGNTPLSNNGNLTYYGAQAVDVRLKRGGPPRLNLAAATDPASLALNHLLKTLDAASPTPSVPPGLIDATLARIAAEAGPVATPRSPAIPTPIVISKTPRRTRHPRRALLGRLIVTGAIAATIVVAMGISIIGAVRARRSAQVVACEKNLALLGKAVGAYAADYHAALPQVARADTPWLPGPTTSAPHHSNFDNLAPLLTRGVTLNNMICPGGAILATYDRPLTKLTDADRGYSYINLAGPIPRRWDGAATTTILTDRNPLFAPRPGATAESNSFNHDSTGTNVLSADGAVRWETTPDVGPAGDNIWTLHGRPTKAQYDGTEIALTPMDVFVSP
jgi:hypothetical protein